MTTRTATCRIFDLNTALDVMAAVENTGSDVLAMLTTGVTFGALDWSDVADYYASPIGPCNACDACRGHGAVYGWSMVRGKAVRCAHPCVLCAETGLATIDGGNRQTPEWIDAVEFVRIGRDRLNTRLRRSGAGDRRFAK